MEPWARRAQEGTCPQACLGRQVSETGEDGTLLEGGRPVLGAGAHPQVCSREEKRSPGRFREKLVFQPDPWFSNLAAHQNRQKNVLTLQSKPVKAGPQSVIVTMNFRDCLGDSEEKLGSESCS